MDYEFYGRLLDRASIRPVAPVFQAYLPETQFQPVQGATSNLYIDPNRLQDPSAWKPFESAPITEQQQRTMGQLETLISGGTLNEALVTKGADPTISLAWRAVFSDGGPLEIMRTPPQKVTPERSALLDKQIQDIVANTPEEELRPNRQYLGAGVGYRTTLSPQAKLLKSKLEEKAYIDARLAGEKTQPLEYFPYMRATGDAGKLWAAVAEPVWNAWVFANPALWGQGLIASESKKDQVLPTYSAEKIIGTDMYDSLTAVQVGFDPVDWFNNTLAADDTVRAGLASAGVDSTVVVNARNEFAARVMVAMRVNSSTLQQRLAQYNPTWLEEVISLGKTLGNTVVNNPDTPVLGTVELGASAITLALTAFAPPVGVAALGALALGGGANAYKAYKAWKALRVVRATASTVWSLGAGGIPAWGRTWGIVRSLAWNGAIAAGTNTTLNYLSQANNIATANGLHYMHPDMSPHLRGEELLESAVYGFMFGAGLSVLGSALSTAAGKIAGSKNTPLDITRRHMQKVFKGTTPAQSVNPIARATVKAETAGRTPSLEETNAAVRARSESVETASSIASDTMDSSPDNVLSRRFNGEDMGTFVQRTADTGSMDSPTVVLDAMSDGRRFDTLDTDEQHQIALESIPVIQAVISKELASPAITKERKAQLAEIEKAAYRVVKKTAKNLTKEEQQTIRERVAKGEAYRRMGIQTPNALDNAETAKKKATANAKEVLDRATGKEPVRNPDTSPESKAAEKTADEIAAELGPELETIPDRVLNSADTKKKILTRITKLLLGGSPELTLRRLAIARAKSNKLSKQQRTNQISVLRRKDMFLSLAVGNRDTITTFYTRIQGLVDMGYISDDAQRLILAMAVNLNFNSKPMQTTIRIATETGYSISDDEIRIGDLTLVTEDATVRQAFIVLHEIGHAYEMYGTGANLMKLRKLFGNMDNLQAVARDLLESDPFNINYTIGNTQELYATGFARMLLNDLRYTLMMNAARENRGLLAYLLQEMVTDIGAALIHAADSLKLSKAVNETELFNIIRETMQHIDNTSKPVMRRLEALTRIAAGVSRVQQSYQTYLEKPSADPKLSFAEWLHKKSKIKELANKLNRALVENVPAAERDQVLRDFGVSEAEAYLIIQGVVNRSVSLDAVINAKMDGFRLNLDSTPQEVQRFIQAVSENHATNKRYFINVYQNYLTALQVNGLRMPKKEFDTAGPVNNQVEALEEFVKGLSTKDLEVQQPYLDPTLGVLSDDINLAMHYLAAQEGLQTTIPSPSEQLLGAPLGKPTKVLTGAEIVKAYKDTNNKWFDVLDTLHKIVVEDLANERVRLEAENKGKTAPLDVEVRLYDKPIRAFFQTSLGGITSNKFGTVRFIAIKSQDIPGNLTPGSALKGWDVADTTVPNDWVMVHEMAHAATVTKIDNYFDAFYRKNYKYTYFEKDFRRLTGKKHLDEIAFLITNPNVDPAMRELLDTYLEAAKASENDWKLMARSANVKGADAIVKRGGEYGFGNVYEFIAQAFNEPKMQERLKSLPSRKRGQTIYTRLLTAMKKLLGLDANQETMFDDVMRLAEEIAITPSEKFDGVRRAVSESVTTAPKVKGGFKLKSGITDILIQSKRDGSIKWSEVLFELDLPTSRPELIVDDTAKTVTVNFSNPTKERLLTFFKVEDYMGEWSIPRSWDPTLFNSVLDQYNSSTNSELHKKIRQLKTKEEVVNFILATAKDMLNWKLNKNLQEFKDKGYTVNTIATQQLLGAPMERPVPNTVTESIARVGQLNAILIENPKIKNDAMLDLITRSFNLSKNVSAILGRAKSPKEMLTLLTAGLKSGTLEVNGNNTRVSLTVIESELSATQLEAALKSLTETKTPTTPLETALSTNTEEALTSAIADVKLPNSTLEAAKADNVDNLELQRRTAALLNAAKDTLENVPEGPQAKPTEAEVRVASIKEAKRRAIIAAMEAAEASVDQPNVARVTPVSEPPNAIEAATAVVDESVTAATPHVPVGIAEHVVSSNSGPERLVSTAPTKVMKTVNVSAERFGDSKLGMVGDVYYSSLAEMEGILLSLSTEMSKNLPPENVIKVLRKLFADKKEDQAIQLFTSYMTDILGLDGVIVRDPKKPNVTVKKFMFNKAKWAYGGIAVQRPRSSKAASTKGVAPDGSKVPENAPEADAPVERTGGREAVQVTDEDRLMVALEESKDAFRDSGMDIPDFRLLLKKFWRVLKDKGIRRAKKIPEEFKDLMYKVSEINATIMEINRQQFRDEKIAQKFWEVVDKLVAIEEGRLVNIPNYRQRSMATIYSEAAQEVSIPNVRFIPPLHASQINFKMGRVNGKNVIRISYKVDKETLNLIKLIREDTSKMSPTTSPLAVRVARGAVPEKPIVAEPTPPPNLPNAPNTKDGTEPPPPKPPEMPAKEKFSRMAALKNLVAVLDENPAMLLRQNNLFGIIFGGSERSTRSWWRTFWGTNKNFVQVLSSMQHTIRSKIAKMRAMSFLYDDTHAVQSTLLGPNRTPLKTALQCHIEAQSAALGVNKAYGELKENAKRIGLNGAQWNTVLKYYAESYLKGEAVTVEGLRERLRMDNIDSLIPVMEKLKTEESRFNQFMLELRQETELNPVLDPDGNPVTGDKYFTITFDSRKWRSLEEADADGSMLERLVEVRTASKLREARLDLNTLIVMGILNIDNMDNIFFGDRSFEVTVNPNLNQETLAKLRQKDGYRVYRKSQLSDSLKEDIYAARKDGARRYFVVETEDQIEVFPVPETIEDLGPTDLRRYQDAIKGDTSMYTPEWRSWLKDKNLVAREMRELVDYKLYRGAYMLRNLEGIKSGGRPILNAKDDNRLRIQNLMPEEVRDNPDLLDVVDLHRQNVAMRLAKHSLFDLLWQRELDRMTGFKGYRIWDLFADMERSLYEDVDARTDLTPGQKDAWRQSIKLGITRLMWQHADWNGTVPRIRTVGDSIFRTMRGLVSARGVAWGMSGLPENMREIFLKMRKAPFSAVPVGLWDTLVSLFARRKDSVKRWDLLDLTYTIEDTQMNSARFDENLEIGNSDADEMGFGTIWRNWKDTKGQGAVERTTAGVEALGQAGIHLGGSKEMMNAARSYSKVRHLGKLYDLISKTNVDKLIALLQDPENARIMKQYLVAAQQSEVDERRAARLFKALVREAGIANSDAMLLESFGLLQPENLKAIRWAINKLGTENGQVNFNELNELYWALRSMDAPEIDPEVFKSAVLKYQVGLENAIRRTSVHHSYGLNKAMGSTLSTTEFGKFIVQLSSWLRGWEDGFAASLAIMGALKTTMSLAILSATMEFLKDRIKEYVGGRDVEDMLEEYGDNPEEIILALATKMPVAGAAQPMVETAVRQAVVLSGGAAKQRGGFMDVLSKTASGGPAGSSFASMLRDVGKGSARVIDGLSEGNMGEVAGGVLDASQVSYIMNNTQFGAPVRLFEEFADLERKHAVQVILDSFQKPETPYRDQGRRMRTTTRPPAPVEGPAQRNRVLEESMLRERTVPKPEFKPAPPMDKTSGVSGILGSLLEGYREGNQ